MADFKTALARTMEHEGKYANDPSDLGGETFRGISRFAHPEWPGWSSIDDIKEDLPRAQWDQAMTTATADLVSEFYSAYFWGPIQGDRIPTQPVADEVFDAAVNQGWHPAVCFLQDALNLLNRNQRDYLDLIVDGQIGPITLAALNRHLRIEKDDLLLLKAMRFLRAEYYVNIMRRRPSQERFARGWFARIWGGQWRDKRMAIG